VSCALDREHPLSNSDANVSAQNTVDGGHFFSNNSVDKSRGKKHARTT
jgi:hypothetical protein